MADERHIRYIDRASGKLEEEVIYGEKLIKWAYQDTRMTGWRSWIFRSALPSKLVGAYFDSRLSRSRIQPAIDQLGIDTSEFLSPVESFRTFNDFFTRRLKPSCRPWSSSPRQLASPADGRTFVYPCVNGDEAVPVKGCTFSASALLGRAEPDFRGGSIVVIRLCPADYHRFHFPVGGAIIDQWEIPGAYHSVNPLALTLGINVFERNTRSCCLLQTECFGIVGIVEVGAFGVGGIVQTYKSPQVSKMDEKGYFKFGGSTLILLIPASGHQLDDDLLSASLQGLETKLRVGESLAGIPDSPESISTDHKGNNL